MTRLQFGTAASGDNIPNDGEPRALSVAGKKMDPEQATVLAQYLGAAVENGVLNPGEFLAGFVNSVKVVPGGRALDELARSQVEGHRPYRPADMFGANGPTV